MMFWRCPASLTIVDYNWVMVIDTTQAVRIKTIVAENGELHLRGPFRAGDHVEVIVLADPIIVDGNHYPLQGTDYSFPDSFSSVVENDWDAMQ